MLMLPVVQSRALPEWLKRPQGVQLEYKTPLYPSLHLESRLRHRKGAGRRLWP